MTSVICDLSIRKPVVSLVCQHVSDKALDGLAIAARSGNIYLQLTWILDSRRELLLGII